MSESPSPQSTPAEHPVEEKDGGSPEKRIACDNHKSGPSADFAALIDAIGREGQANRAEEKREDRGKGFREYLTLIFIIATTAGVFYQAHIFSNQLEEMHAASKQTEQLIETNRKLVETAAQQAAAAVKQAAATDKQADALAQSAQVSHESMILGQRAWVGPNTATFSAEPSVGKPIEILIAYQNTGCQPALQFVSVGDAFSATVAEDAMEQLYKELPNIWKDAKTPLYGKAEASPIQVSDLVPITSAPKPKMNLLTMRL